MQPIHLRNVPPPAETFAHTEFFDLLFKWIRPEHYLELGVRHGVIVDDFVNNEPQYNVGDEDHI